MKTPLMIMGDVASSGVARGHAFVCRCTEGTASQRNIGEDEVEKELMEFDSAISEAEKELLDLQEKVERKIGRQNASIFEAHVLLLRDPLLRSQVRTICQTKKMNVEAALEEAINNLTSLFINLEDSYFRERAADLKDVGKRLHDILEKSGLPRIPFLPDESVLVVSELLPSIVAHLDKRSIRGLIVEKGGQTAHATILARAGSIPMLIQVPDATKNIRTGDELIVDGLSGRVFINPKPEILREYERLEADLQSHQTALKGLIDLPAITRDGIQVKLCANIGKSADAVTALKLNSDGIGLYRTEFIFLVLDHLPSEEEQYAIYHKTADRLNPREVVIRLLDIGSDKVLPHFPMPLETNPSLGRRGVRMLLAHPEILHTQLRAILRLSVTHPVSILLPMIGGVEDVLEVRAAIEKAKMSLASEHQPFNQDIPVGAMIETPSAVIMLERLAQDVDYFSVGTNDLVQYLLTSDRTSSDMASYYEPLHPAVLKTLTMIAAVARAKGKSVSICGEMAGNPAYTVLLLGMGFRNFSVNPGELLAIKSVIRSTDIQEAEDLAEQILKLDTIKEIKDRLRSTVLRI